MNEEITKIIKALQQLNNKIQIILNFIAQGEEQFYIEYSIAKQERFLLEKVLDNYLIPNDNEEVEIDEYAIELIEKYSIETNEDVFEEYENIRFEISVSDFLSIKESEMKRLEKRILRFAKQIESYAPTFIKDNETFLMNDSVFLLCEVNKILKIFSTLNNVEKFH